MVKLKPLFQGILMGYKGISQGEVMKETSFEGEIDQRDKVSLKTAPFDNVHFSKDERDIIGFMYLASAEYGDDDIIKDRCVYTEDPHKYVHVPMKLKVKRLKAGLEVSAGVAAIIAGYLAGMVLIGGNLVGGVIGGLLGTAIYNILGTKASKEMLDREMDTMKFIHEALKDKGITPEEAILRLRKHKPVYIVTSLDPFKTIKLTSIDDAYRKLVTRGYNLSSNHEGPKFEAFRG